MCYYFKCFAKNNVDEFRKFVRLFYDIKEIPIFAVTCIYRLLC